MTQSHPKFCHHFGNPGSDPVFGQLNKDDTIESKKLNQSNFSIAAILELVAIVGFNIFLYFYQYINPILFESDSLAKLKKKRPMINDFFL